MTSTPRSAFLVLVLLLLSAPAVFAQQASPQAEAARQKTRERLGNLLTRIGPTVKVEFRPSQNNQFTFVGVMKEGLKNSDSFEIVILVNPNETISIRVFPHYKGGYINIDKARNPQQLLRQLVQYNHKTFLFWGADNTGDIFTGYTFTLESGFPDAGIQIVLESIRNSDQYVGEMRASIDGSSAAP